MDNVTHSLFGYALGRACHPRGQPPAPLQRALVASSVVASNAPDLDFVTGFFADDRRLSYLLDHRGFTHTLLFAVLIGAASGFGCALSFRLRAARARLAAVGLGVVACLFHVGFDFLNDYGVHPFFPFDNRWYYGDSVFIIEPLLIAVLAPLPLWFAWSRIGRGLSGAAVLGLCVLVWFALAWPRALAVTLASIAALAVQRRLGPRAFPALSASAILVAFFATGSRLAEAAVQRVLREQAPEERVLDIASTPAPADPTCHRALAITLDRARDRYRVRLGRVQLFGDASSCRLLPSAPSAPLTAADVPGRGNVRFDAMFAAPASELAQLAAAECDAAAMLRFVRVPFWQRRPDGTLLGDLRYDRGPALEFAERLLTGVCGSARGPFAPWVPPRSDVMAISPR